MSEINENPSTENATENVAENTTTENNVVEEKTTETIEETANSGGEEVKGTETTTDEVVEKEAKEKYLETSPVLKTVALALEKIVEDRSKTNLEPLTEKELMDCVGSSLAGVTAGIEYNPENKKEGCFTFTEFGKVTRVPEEGFFTFGTDFSAPTK